ncbi:MAG TPA: glycosyltransferase family 4 protein [Aggregatilineales bacterium]|nr:glycosyltransferase family 4 protein [Aggregatilineales bacterium]
MITHHGDLILPPGIKNRLIQGLTFTLFKVAARRAARLIGYSRDYADHSYYLTPFKDKVAVNYPPIHMPPPDPERADELRADWQRDGGILIGYCGRFVQEKRPDVLIRSLDVILKTHPNARIVFAGQYNIPYEDTWQVYQPLIETYRDHLIFLGIITSREALANFYAALDVFVLPSDTECFALVQVEAMLCGAPVVMTDTPGGRVPVTVTGMGKIVPRGDHQTMGRAVIDIVANRAAYVKPRHEIERIFNFEETIATYERHFREAVEG